MRKLFILALFLSSTAHAYLSGAGNASALQGTPVSPTAPVGIQCLVSDGGAPETWAPGSCSSGSGIAGTWSTTGNIVTTDGVDTAQDSGLAITNMCTLSGTQTISGAKTFSSAITMGGSTAQDFLWSTAGSGNIGVQTGQLSGTDYRPNNIFAKNSISVGNVLGNNPPYGLNSTNLNGFILSGSTNVANSTAFIGTSNLINSEAQGIIGFGKDGSFSNISAFTNSNTSGDKDVYFSLLHLSSARSDIVKFGSAGSFGLLYATASTVPYLDSSKNLVSSAVTPIELGYVSGVTSAIQTQFTAKAPLASPSLTGNPTAPTQSASDNSTRLASTAYVTTGIANAIAAVNPAVAVYVATTSASNTSGLTYSNGVSGIGASLTGSVNTAITIDGQTLTAVGQRVLVKNDTQSPSGAYNGVYYLSQLQTGILAPILIRALDYDQPSDINNTGAIPVVAGTANASTSWLLTSSVTTMGTDALTYTKFTANPSTLLPLSGVGLVEQTPGFVITPTDMTYVLDQSASYAYTINTLIIATASGTTTAAVKINGTNVTGISAVSVSSSPATGTATAANSVAIGDKVTLVLSSSSSPTNMGFTLKVTR